jgi:hypothetical protein
MFFLKKEGKETQRERINEFQIHPMSMFEEPLIETSTLLFFILTSS